MACELPHVLVTGAGTGFGAATVSAAQEVGFHVIAGLYEPRNGDDLIGSTNPTELALDVTHRGQITSAVNRIRQHVGESGLDALVNVAAIDTPAPLELVSIERLRRVFEVNTIGQMAVTQAVLPLLRRASGRIVFLGPSDDSAAVPFVGPLASSKSATTTIAETLRLELEPWDVNVIVVEPRRNNTGAKEITAGRVARALSRWTTKGRELYEAAFEEVMEAFIKEEERGEDVAVVAETIMLALTSYRPRARYTSGAGANILAALADVPQSWQDAAKRKLQLPRPRSKPHDQW